MIVVVEGISAAGKTTWCHKYAAELTVPETGNRNDAPDPALDPIGAARFWVEQGERRWFAACAIERSKGLAVCDTDPLKLHYIWSLWQIGVAPERYWHEERIATRLAIADGRLGFADIYLVKRIDPQLARQQRDADATRSRRNFDLHVKLHHPLMAWYRAMERVLPGAVTWNLPDSGLAGLSGRSDAANGSPIDIFDQMMDLLPKRSPTLPKSRLKASEAKVPCHPVPVAVPAGNSARWPMLLSSA
jgi:hypothetical protein